MAASGSKMLQIASKCCKFHGKWEFRIQTCCKYCWNGTFQLQNANSKENGRNREKNKQKTYQTILDPFSKMTQQWLVAVFFLPHIFELFMTAIVIKVVSIISIIIIIIISASLTSLLLLSVSLASWPLVLSLLLWWWWWWWKRTNI